MGRALNVRDLDVWREAQQIIDRYPSDPESVACERADCSWKAGDMTNFQIRMRVAKAVQELVRTKPHLRSAIN